MAPAALVRQRGGFRGGWTVGFLSQPKSSGRHGGGCQAIPQCPELNI
jgi:hypothetical protein